jgi:cytochrome c oxidase accessory protein FixG
MSKEQKERTFRDRLSIVSEEGKRIWIYAKKPRGKLYNLRLLFGYLLILIFILGPYFKVNGRPIFLIDILERKFILFTKVFWPQDFYMFFLIMISIIIFIILFTVIYGRIFCGWACPQSVFMELVFRNIEWLVEGGPAKQKELNQQILTAEKIIKKTIKHILFWLVSFCFGVTLLSYLNGYESVFAILKGEHSGKFVGIIIFSTVIYIVFSQIRELVCTIICPYGRLQGVLLDKNSIAVSYDYKRGEPRGKQSDSESGDCIDCANCLHVCPSGIDIRNGVQLECTNCTACIDACNSVMNRIGKPKGLIRYASLNNIEKGEKVRFNARIIGYTSVLLLLLIFLSYLLTVRTDIQTTILRTSGTLFQEQPEGKISNLYNINILNKTHKSQVIELKLESPEGEIQMAGSQKLIVKDQGSLESVFFIVLDKSKIKTKQINLTLSVYSNNELIENKKLVFISSN